jgi:Ni,Fe-hydrogenase III large subunit
MKVRGREGGFRVHAGERDRVAARVADNDMTADDRLVVLKAVIEGNIVADFPLCNKSFNCSYSGHDL